MKKLPTLEPDAERREWLTLKEASSLLGIHFTTLRAWANQGDIRVFRTPGGHRRFALADIRRFLQERATQTELTDADALLASALGRVRQQIAKIPQEKRLWRQDMEEAVRQANRERGQRMFALAIHYILKPRQRLEILEDGRELGREYGRQAAQSRISLVETGRAVQFFRRQLLEALHKDESLDAEDIRIRQLLAQFLDEVLYAVLEGYESVLHERTGGMIG